MGHILKQLAKRDICSRTIFNNRFTIEISEKVHLHYRNLRIILNLSDFLELCKGCIASLDRWAKLGLPEPKEGQHIELCRKKVATEACNAGIQVSLNSNLYNKNEGKIYAEGAEFTDDQYVHIKIRDIRIECSIKEFEVLADAIIEAKERLKDFSISPLL